MFPRCDTNGGKDPAVRMGCLKHVERDPPPGANLEGRERTGASPGRVLEQGKPVL